MLLIGVFLLILDKSTLSAEEEPETFPLTIESTTENCSARCKINSGNEEEDKKRTKIGIGETVTLPVTGKNVDQSPKDIEWEILSGNDLITRTSNTTKEVVTFTFTATLNLKQQATVSIQAKLQDLKSKPITFTIVPPEGVEAQHSFYNGKLGCPIPLFDEQGNIIAWYSNDIDNSQVSVSAFLEVTVLPIDVNFQDVPIIENPHHDDSNQGVIVYPGFYSTLAFRHNPNPEPFYPDEKNMFNDGIGFQSSTEHIIEIADKHLHPQKFSYVCSYHVKEIKGNQIGKETILQTVSIFTPDDGVGVIVSITKMNRSVSKQFFSRTEGKHHFK